MIGRRLFAVLIVASLVSSLVSSPGWAQNGGPLRIVVPFAAGGAQDVIARYLAAKLGERLDRSVIVDNKAGGGGVIASDAVAKSAPDGTTLLMATGGAISIAPHLQAKLPYDSRHDFAAVAMVADTPMTLAVRSQSPNRSVADLLADAKARPGQVSFASTGPGTVSHLTGELLAQAAGVKLLHVPYRGAGPATTDLLSGEVASMVTSVASIDPLVQSGRARVLATFTTGRVTTLGSPPTIAEATGIKGLEVPVWVGLLAPARTPPAVLEKLAADILAICRLPETQERFRSFGAEPSCRDPQAFDRVVAEDLDRWGKVIRQSNIKTE